MLFRTYPEFESPLPTPPEMFGAPIGTKNWRAFEMGVKVYWFIVEVLIKGDPEPDSARWKTMMFCDRSDMLNILAEPDIIDNRIHVVIPGYASETGELAMALVAEIQTGIEPEYDQVVTIFRTVDGKSYMESGVETSVEGIKDKKTMYFRKTAATREAKDA